MENRNIDFIVRRYRKGRFSPESGWHRFGVVPVSAWHRFRVAAAVAATVVLSAAAAYIYKEYHVAEPMRQSTPVSAVSPLTEVKVIDFENAPLAEVVRKIETVYDVKVLNLPDNSSVYELSLHYEGTPTDLIAVINDILGTQMTVAEK